MFEPKFPENLCGGGRKPWVDALRALAMLFVVYGHIVKDWTAFFVFTSPIKIPLFFAVTGYVFKEARKTSDFYIFLVKKLVIPWLVLGMSVAIIFMPFKGIDYFLGHFQKIITGEELWYMPCCIMAEIIWNTTLKFCGQSRKICAVSVVFFVAGFVMAKLNVLNILMVNRAFVVQIYLLIGYIFKKYERKFTDISCLPIIVGVLIYVLMGSISLMVFPGQTLDIHVNRYYNIPYCLLMIYIGCLLAFCIALKAKKFPGWLIYIGQNTLVIYIFHGYILVVLERFISRCWLQNKAIALVSTLLSCMICCVGAEFINLFMPELIGKKRKFYREPIRH